MVNFRLTTENTQKVTLESFGLFRGRCLFAADIERSPKMLPAYCWLLIIRGISSFVFWNRTDMSTQNMEDVGFFLSQHV